MQIVGYCISDIHLSVRLGSGPWSENAELADESFRALRKVCEAAARESADVFLAGDIFDGARPDAASLLAASQAFKPLAVAELTCYYVIGNHDHQDWLAPLGSHLVCVDNVTALESKYGYEITGQSYTPDFVPSYSPAFGVPSIGLYHQTFKEFYSRGKDTIDALPNHDVSVCGDVHVRKIVRTQRGGLVVSPGPLIPCSVDEITRYNPKVVALVYDSAAKVFNLQEVDVGLRNWSVIDVDSDLDGAFHTLTLIPSETVVAVKGTYSAEFEEAARVACKRTGSLPVFRKAQKQIRDTLANVSYTVDVRGALFDAIMSSNKLSDGDKQLAAICLSSNNLKKTLQDEKDEFVKYFTNNQQQIEEDDYGS